MEKKKSEKQLKKEYEARIDRIMQRAVYGLRVNIMQLGPAEKVARAQDNKSVEDASVAVRAYMLESCGAVVVD